MWGHTASKRHTVGWQRLLVAYPEFKPFMFLTLVLLTVAVCPPIKVLLPAC